VFLSVIGDQIVRKGTTVFIFIFGIHNDENVFPDPDKFDPERFVESSLISDKRSPFAFIPFSSGSRNCIGKLTNFSLYAIIIIEIGQRFAGLEERVVLSTLFLHFSFRSTQTIDQLHLSIDAILRARIPIQMSVERRQ
jgi:cytochrome P450